MDYQQVDFTQFGAHCLPGFMGIEIVSLAATVGIARMEVKEMHFAPNGYVHAGSVVSLADTLAGYACIFNLPENGKSFTTMELKTNFLGTTKAGFLRAEAMLVHGGKTTQVWDVVVTLEETGKKLALFRCTQLILY